MQTLNRRHFLGFTALFLLPQRAYALDIGFQVTDVLNKVTVQDQGAPSPIPLETLSNISPNAEIATAKESAAALTNADGGLLTIGQRSKATIMPDFSAALLSRGSFRYRGTATLTTPHLKIDAQAAEFVLTVTDTQTICGTLTGTITCTPLKKGTAAKVTAGESIAWLSGTFGPGVTKGIYQTGDTAADRGLDAARSAWAPG